MYRVLRPFVDLEDGGRYGVGDEFPHTGITVSPMRLKRLSSTMNRQGVQLIEEVEEQEREPQKRSRKSKRS